MSSFLALVVVLVFILGDGNRYNVYGNVLNGKDCPQGSEDAHVFFNSVGRVVGNLNEDRKYLQKDGSLFNGKDSLTLSEYTQKSRDKTEAGYELSKAGFEKMDKNGNGLLEYQERWDFASEESDKFYYFFLADRDDNGFLDLTEIKSFALVFGCNALGDWKRSRITEESLKQLLRQGVGVDYLSLNVHDNQLDAEEYLRWALGLPALYAHLPNEREVTLTNFK